MVHLKNLLLKPYLDLSMSRRVYFLALNITATVLKDDFLLRVSNTTPHLKNNNNKKKIKKKKTTSNTKLP
jgi:hypothetical protein